MSILINSSTVNTGSNTSYEAKINQLETQLQSYEAELQKETDLDKQNDIKTKIQNIQTQIKNYEAKTASSSNSAADSEELPKNYNSSQTSDTIEISKEGKVLSEFMKTLNENKEKVVDKKEISEEGKGEEEKAEVEEKEKKEKEALKLKQEQNQVIMNHVSILA